MNLSCRSSLTNGRFYQNASFLFHAQVPNGGVEPNEPVEKVTFLKTASSVGPIIGNYFLSSKVFTILGTMSLFS
jgi:hypothetical protein